MTAEFILPVTVPGATEAAAQMRAFKTEAAGAAVAGEAAGKAAAGVGKAQAAGGAATSEATVKNKAHIRTLDEEILRLKALEHQTKVTAQARLALGESSNAADISAMRRFSRSLPGGIGKEIGRGAVEGFEGAEGTGLKASLGAAGAGLAALAVGFELFHGAMELSAESIHREIEERAKLAEILAAGQESAAKGGEAYLKRHGQAMTEIVANGGDEALAAANKYADTTKDPSALEGYADLSKRIPASHLQEALGIAGEEHELGGGSIESIAKKLNLERLERQEPGSDQIIREDLSDTERGVILSSEELDKRRANLAGSHSLGALRSQETDESRIDKANRGHADIAKASSSAAAAAAANPTTANYLATQSKGGFAESEELRLNADSIFGAIGNPFGKGSARFQYRKQREAAADAAGKAVTADANMQGGSAKQAAAEAARAFADALEAAEAEDQAAIDNQATMMGSTP